ncbi:MAG: OmpA family protein [Simkaniaceae bacterium]|nr:OmpA family protein [Candidatus Sacchlamyda saccharinae]
MKRIVLLLCALSLLTGCSRSTGALSALQSRWEKLKTLWGDDTDGMLASEGFYGPIDDEFIPLEEDDLQMQLAEAAIPQPRDIPGSGNIPSLNQFKKAFSDLAGIFQNVYFNTDDHVLRRPEYTQIIDKAVAYMKKHPNVYISVGGHCDERGSEAYNLALGTRRSNYIRSLIVQRGISPNRVHSISYGKEHPSDQGHNPSAWARNRRAEFRIWEK